MIEIVPQKKINMDLGDLIYNPHNIIHSIIDVDSIVKEDLRYFPLTFAQNPITTLYRLKISNKEFNNSIYTCPFTQENKYYGITPFLIQTENSKPYYENNIYFKKGFNFAFDLDFQQDFAHYCMENIGIITQAILGHGYNAIFLPSDGDNKIINVKIKLSNDDFIIAKTFLWYNK